MNMLYQPVRKNKLGHGSVKQGPDVLLKLETYDGQVNVRTIYYVCVHLPSSGMLYTVE